MTKIPTADYLKLTSRIHARLSVLREEIRVALHDSSGSDDRGLANHFAETGESAFANLASAVDLAELHRDIAEFNALGGALRRIASGTYGACSDCGAQIPTGRLCVQPEAERCIRCQTRYEAEEGVSSSSL